MSEHLLLQSGVVIPKKSKPHCYVTESALQFKSICRNLLPVRRTHFSAKHQKLNFRKQDAKKSGIVSHCPSCCHKILRKSVEAICFHARNILFKLSLMFHCQTSQEGQAKDAFGVPPVLHRHDSMRAPHRGWARPTFTHHSYSSRTASSVLQLALTAETS